MILWTFWLFIVASFLTLPRNPLLNDDAANYALMAKNAIIHNQWLVQYFTPGDPASFLDKPPLGIWLLAWLPKLTGVNQLTVHIPNLIYYGLLLALLYWGISHLGSKKLALYSTIIAATSLALVVYARAPKLDVPLTLFVTAANLALFVYLKKGKPVWLYLFALALAGGFLVKSGFGLLMPALTVLGILVTRGPGREKLLPTIFTKETLFSLLILLAVVGAVLGAQAFVLQDQFLPYLKSITIQGKYNASYLGVGFNSSIILLLLITLFPWTPFFAASILPKQWNLNRRANPKVLSLSRFSLIWFWSNFLFLLFFYKQTDFRTFTLLVPPMAIISALSLSPFIKGRKRGGLVVQSINFFFLFIFAVAFFLILNQPQNAQGINLSAALLPVGFFTLALIVLPFALFLPSFFPFSFLLVCLAYVVLFWNTLPLANAFNPDITWPKLIGDQRAAGTKFYIYRPPDRNLFFSPDLCYVDFLAGPADQYFWEGNTLKAALAREKAIVLSDTKSWEKLGIHNAKIMAQDNYSQISGIIK